MFFVATTMSLFSSDKQKWGFLSQMVTALLSIFLFLSLEPILWGFVIGNTIILGISLVGFIRHRKENEPVRKGHSTGV